MNGLHVRAAGAEEIMRQRRLIGRSWAPPQLHRFRRYAVHPRRPTRHRRGRGFSRLQCDALATSPHHLIGQSHQCCLPQGDLELIT